ncbi:MAG: RimK family alpha-L-glutamate ligase [Clostridiales bacterium]|nr:RimK family alpha-L-glutamate ligase [Clostridiales bacterium]
MKGVILTNPYDTYSVQRHKVQRMQQELTALGVDVCVTPNDQFVADITNGKINCNVNADFVLFFDKDKYTGAMLEKCGVRLFNSASATAICDDKMLTHITLAGHGIPMPDTLPGALCYNPDGTISEGYAQLACDKLGLPMVVKQCHGSYGEQVYLVSTKQELVALLSEIKTKAYLLQRFERQSCGRDMRVIVIGGKAQCAMLRENMQDFRSNVAHGGRAEAVNISKSIAKMCEKAAKIIGLDYCGIDVLLGDNPKICEVNSNAMFEAMEQVTGVNVARLYAEHIVNSVNNHRKVNG